MFLTGHNIPYIFMEWSEIAGPLKSSLCPDLDILISLLKSAGYHPRDALSLSAMPESCLQSRFADVLWVHQDATKIWEEESEIACKVVDDLIYIEGEGFVTVNNLGYS